MALKEIKTFKDIQDAIIRRGKLDGIASVRDDLKEKINTTYQHIAFKRSYRWSGETRQFKLEGKYTTGTIDVTNGSNVITGTSTNWDQFAHEGAKMKLSSVASPFRILDVGSSTSITLDAQYTGVTDTGLSYILYKDEYGLFPDLHNIRKIMLPGQKRFVLPTSPEEIDSLRFESPFREGLIRKYTINGKRSYKAKTWANFLMDTDFWEDIPNSKPRNQNLIIWPSIISNERIAQIRYTKIVEPMGEDDDEPLIPYENRRVLVYGVLLEHFLQHKDIVTSRSWEKKYKQDLKEMESDVETIDDELILKIDRTMNRRNNQAIWFDDAFDVS